MATVRNKIEIRNWKNINTMHWYEVNRKYLSEAGRYLTVIRQEVPTG
jgi:hypothetical protein